MYTYTHTHTHTHSYIDTYVYTYIHTYVYTYIHIYLHTHTHTGGQQPLPGGDVQREEVLCAVDDVVDWRAELFPGLRLHRRRRHLYCSCSWIPGQATHFAAQNGRCKISHFPIEGGGNRGQDTHFAAQRWAMQNYLTFQKRMCSV